MRHEVAIALIACGTLLALAPPFSDYLVRRQVAEVIVSRTDFNNVSFNVEAMSSEYRFGCWILGATMISIGVVTSFRCPGKRDGDSIYLQE
jgi:hypothetical protein